METKRTSTKEIIAYLNEKFPACFSLEGPAKPLKVGIFQDLSEKLTDDESISKTRLRQALRHYTSSWRYLKAVKVGAFRVDIDGNDVSEIDQAQADHASKTLKESQEKYSKPKGQKPSDANKKPHDKTASKAQKPAPKSPKNTEKFKSVKSSKPAKAQPKVELKPVSSSTVVVGAKVKVKLGNAPMDAVITEVTGKDVSVQLNSGMLIKTQVANIFTE